MKNSLTVTFKRTECKLFASKQISLNYFEVKFESKNVPGEIQIQENGKLTLTKSTDHTKKGKTVHVQNIINKTITRRLPD